MDEILTGTPYDDAFRTMYVECDELVLPLLNEVFHTHYTGSERIIRLGNEHFDNRQGGVEDKRITDAFLEVVGKERRKYHLECESGTDGSIIVRMFQYGAQLSLVESRIEDGQLCVKFPEAAVLYLRSSKDTPDKMGIRIETPGGVVSYEIPTIRMSSYTIEALFGKRLYFLIPFYIFNLERELKQYEEDDARLAELKKQYVEIQKRLEQKVLEHDLQTFSWTLIRELSNKVAQNLARNYDKVREGIGDVMGGNVLELEESRRRNGSRDEGLNEGWTKGRNMMVSAIQMLKNGQSDREILDAGIDEETLKLAKTCR